MIEAEKKEKAKRSAKEAIERIKALKEAHPDLTQGPVRNKPKKVIENADKEAKREKQQKKEADKKLPKEDKKLNTAKVKVEEAKKALEEAKKKNNPKGIEKAEDKLKKAQKALEKARKAKMEKEKLSLKDIAKRTKATEEKLDKAGVKKKDPKDKDDKTKGKDKDKEKQKDNEQTKSDQKVQLASKINVNGMDIQQHGPKFVLVGKNGRETDVTDVMNEIDKYNKGVDAKNAAAKAQSTVQKGVEAKAQDMNPAHQGLPTNGTSGNVQVKGTPELVPPVSPVQQKGAEDIVSAKLPQLNPEEKAAVAKTALELSKTGLLKDPKGLEKLNERKKKNDEREQQLLAMQRAKQQAAGK